MCAVCWWLSASRKWSQEAVENVSSYFHIVCWALPAVLAIALLVLRKFEADELTGLCQVGTGLALFAPANWSAPASSAAAAAAVAGGLGKHALLLFLMLPLALALLLGVALLVAGCVAIVKVKSELKQLGTNTVALEKLTHKMILFGIFYVLISLCQLGCYAYEYFSLDAWRARVMDEQRERHEATSAAAASGAGASGGAHPQVVVFFLRVTASLALACTLLVWICSKKTLLAWRTCLTCVCARGARKPRTPSCLYDAANPHNSAMPLIALSSQQQQQQLQPDFDLNLNLSSLNAQQLTARAQFAAAGATSQTLIPLQHTQTHLKNSQSLHNRLSDAAAAQRVPKHKSHQLYVPTAPSSENTLAAAVTAQSHLPLPDLRGMSITPTLPSPSNLMNLNLNMNMNPSTQQMQLFGSALPVLSQQQQQMLTSPKRSATAPLASTTSSTSFANMASTAVAPLLAPAPTPISFESANSRSHSTSTTLGAQQAAAGGGGMALVPGMAALGPLQSMNMDVQLQNMQAMCGGHQHLLPSMQTQLSLSSGASPTSIYEALQHPSQHSPSGPPPLVGAQGLSVALPPAPVPARRSYR